MRPLRRARTKDTALNRNTPLRWLQCRYNLAPISIVAIDRRWSKPRTVVDVGPTLERTGQTGARTAQEAVVFPLGQSGAFRADTFVLPGRGLRCASVLPTVFPAHCGLVASALPAVPERAPGPGHTCTTISMCDRDEHSSLPAHTSSAGAHVLAGDGRFSRTEPAYLAQRPLHFMRRRRSADLVTDVAGERFPTAGEAQPSIRLRIMLAGAEIRQTRANHQGTASGRLLLRSCTHD